VLARIRVSVPDRPGSLGLLASAIGAAGGDIAAVDVLESEAGRALDDVFVQVRDGAHVEQVRRRVAALTGFEVAGVQHPAPPSSGHAELELAQQVLGQPGRALRTLVDGAPGALGADWAAVLLFGPDGAQEDVLATSERAPASGSIAVSSPLRLTTVRVGLPEAAGARTAPGTAAGSTSPATTGAALVPLGGSPLGLLLVRAAGLGFHRSELWRLAQLGSVVATITNPVRAV
jgi:hypothetical protein